MSGSAGYLLHGEVENAAEFERIRIEILSTLPGVTRTLSSFAIRNVPTAGKQGASKGLSR